MKLIDDPLDAQVSPEGERSLPAPRQRLDCRVLMAEDGFDNQRLISVILRKAGADVVVPEDGQTAYDRALAATADGLPFDVVLMDTQMPVMDGYQTTTKLREAGHTGPIMALTANAMAADRDRCLAAGCDAYMAKPIDRVALAALVRQYACGGPRPPAHVAH